MAYDLDCRYNGKFGRLGDTITASIAAANISDTEIAIGDAIHTGVLTFAGAARTNGGTGTIKEVVVKVNNDDTAAVTSTFILYLFNNSDLTAPTSNSALALDAADWTGFQAKITLPALVQDVAYLSSAFKIEDHKFETVSNDDSLYGILVVSTPATTFDASATIIVEIKVEKD